VVRWAAALDALFPSSTGRSGARDYWSLDVSRGGIFARDNDSAQQSAGAVDDLPGSPGLTDSNPGRRATFRNKTSPVSTDRVALHCGKPKLCSSHAMLLQPFELG
jgi:hypothetical protein